MLIEVLEALQGVGETQGVQEKLRRSLELDLPANTPAMVWQEKLHDFEQRDRLSN